MGNAAWKLLGTGSALIAGIVATKVADQIWEKAARQQKIDPKNPNAPLMAALLYAGLTGLAAGVARTMATRQSAKVYAKSAGHLPADVKDSDL